MSAAWANFWSARTKQNPSTESAFDEVYENEMLAIPSKKQKPLKQIVFEVCKEWPVKLR